MSDCLFCAIVAGGIPAEVLHSDDDVLAFRDVNPQAPVHVLIIPRAHHATAAELATADPALAGRLLQVAGELAAREGIDGTGYRIVTNTGESAGQSVSHVHFHLLGGRALNWPPG